MKTRKLLAPFLALAACGLTQAQETDFEGVVLYKHGNYGGNTLTLYPGEGIANLGDYWESSWDSWNDEVSSLAVWGNVVVYLYEHANYQGQILEVYDHVPYLSDYGWNDRVSSIWVDWAEPIGWYWDYTLKTWIYRESNGWLYHQNGLGWIYGYYYDTLAGEGWIWDQRRGWLWTNPTYAPWFVDGYGVALFYQPKTKNPRWWYSEVDGWFTD